MVVVAAGGAEQKRILRRVGSDEREAVHAPEDEGRDDEGHEEVEPEGPDKSNGTVAIEVVGGVGGRRGRGAVGSVGVVRVERADAADGEEGGHAEDAAVPIHGLLEGIAHEVASVSDEVVGADVHDGVELRKVLSIVQQLGDAGMDDVLDLLGRGVARVQGGDGGRDAALVEGVEGGEECFGGFVYEAEGGGELLRVGSVFGLDTLQAGKDERIEIRHGILNVDGEALGVQLVNEVANKGNLGKEGKILSSLGAESDLSNSDISDHGREFILRKSEDLIACGILVS